MDGPLIRYGFTYLDEGCRSRVKLHMESVMIGRSGCVSKTIGILPAPRDDFTGVAIACKLEAFILKYASQIESDEKLCGYNFTPSMKPATTCNDSVGPNARATKILAVRQLSVIFIPCFSHLSYLQYG